RSLRTLIRTEPSRDGVTYGLGGLRNCFADLLNPGRLVNAHSGSACPSRCHSKAGDHHADVGEATALIAQWVAKAAQIGGARLDGVRGCWALRSPRFSPRRNRVLFIVAVVPGVLRIEPRWIHRIQGVVRNIRVSVERLTPSRLQNRIRLHESADARVIDAPAHVDE